MNIKSKTIEIIFFVVILLYFNFKLFFSIEFITPNYQTIEQVNLNSLEDKEKNQLSFFLDKGLIYKYYFQREFFNNLYPSYLDNEHIPNRIFQYLSQDMKKNLISIFIIIALDILIILLLITILHQLSFYFQFKKLLLIFILISLFINLLLIERPKLIKLLNLENQFQFFIPLIFNSLLIFFSTWFLLDKPSEEKLKPFLNFYFKNQFELTQKIPSLFLTIKEMFIISIISVFITNAFLFPVFYIQILYNIPFHILIVILLLFLVIYYIYAYYNVSKNKDENPKVSYAISFLGFRIISNFIQILFLILFLISLGIIISIIIIANNQVLQNLNLIPRNFSL